MKKIYLLKVAAFFNTKKSAAQETPTSIDKILKNIIGKIQEVFVHNSNGFFENLFQKNHFTHNMFLHKVRLLVINFINFLQNTLFFQEHRLVKISCVSYSHMVKKITTNRNALLVFTMFLFVNFTSAQLQVPFTPRLPGGNVKVKGDVVLIGNTILNRTTSNPSFSNPQPVDGVLFTGTVTNLAALTTQANTALNRVATLASNIDNNTENLEYIDIDSDTSTFSSSSATLGINNSCKKIVYAGLYWSAIYPYERSTDAGKPYDGTTRYEDWNTIKLKVPGSTTYTNLTADDVIYDGYNSANRKNSFYLSAYVCYKDVTANLAALSEADGAYTIANMRAARGKRTGGCAGGWTLVVIYESPTVPSKFISVFDGYANLLPDVGPNQFLQTDINISGFNTLPGTLPVNAKIGISALEGDIKRGGDFFLFKAASIATPFTEITDAINTTGNFFNATISSDGVDMPGRNPSSTNTMGFDLDNAKIPNPGNAVIPNNETAATLRLKTDSGSGDGYAAYLTTFAVEIIEPVILLTKQVFNSSGVDVGNANVILGQELNYVIGFQNQGNDNATAFTIKDVLPINTIFNYPADIDATSLPAGVTHTYNAATRTIIFTVPNNLVEQTDPRYEIRFKVKVVEHCNELSDACSNIIKNSAYATYRGVINSAQITDDPSLSTYVTCNIGNPDSTNFLVGIDDCIFTKAEVLCGNNVVLTASDGYDSYKWSTAPFNSSGVTTGTILGNSRTLTVTNTGTYYVYNTAVAPCLSITEVVTVTPFGTVISNPVIPFADEVVTCPNDLKKLPNIFLCGATATRLINTAISDGSTIIWEKLNEASCTPAIANCANESTTCTWTQVATGPSYAADTSGQYRLTLNYPGNCFNRFYFNVYKNLLAPTETHRDIVCTTPGNITINGVGLGYEYSLDGTTYQASNSFSVNTAGPYTAYIRQVGIATNPCIFTIPDIQIRQRNFTVTTELTQPSCFGGKGSIKVAANDVLPQYTYQILNGATSLNLVGPIVAGDYTFSNLSVGNNYIVKVTTQDGCTYTSGPLAIVQPAALTATAVITTPLTSCSDGTITIIPVGGTAPYYYYINGSSTFQTSADIAVTSPGLYSVRVVDSRNCEITTSVTVPSNTKPTFTITSTNSDCFGSSAGININLTNANGYSMSYSINNGVNFSTNPTFSNLTPGTYDVVVRYGITYKDKNGVNQTIYCLDPAVPIIITGPASALTASAGVGELAGCGPLQGGQPTGLVRITNAEGGTAPYEYSFDGGATWGATNEKYVLPGTYTFAVRDSKGCTVSIPAITLDPKPADPTITVGNPVFNCNGTASSTVTVTNASSVNYNYEYYIDGVPNTPITNNVFSNVGSGSHTVSVKYNLVDASTYSNLLTETFGYGDDTTSPGINTTFYCFERQVAATQCRNSTAINDGDYSVTAKIVNPFGAWIQPGDHTPPTVPPTPKGRSLVVNIGDQIATQDVLYRKVINNIIPNQPINFELYAINLLKTGNTQVDANLAVALVNSSGVEISSFATGDIPKTQLWEKYPKTAITLNPGANTTLTFIVRSNKRATSGNDVAIDDIRVYQLPKSCLSQKDFPIIIDSNQAFTASITGSKNLTCAGANDGEITIAAQNFAPTGFYYSLDGAAFVLRTTSPLTLTGLAAGSHSVRVQYDLTASPCLFTLPQTITAPTAVTAAATITLQPTCTTGATIRATGSGGTPAYQYELRNTTGGAIVRAFQATTDFTNVPTGNYTVFVRDANLCVSSVGAPVNVTAPVAPVATISNTSDLCFDTVNQATLVVSVTGGTSPFTYTLDAGAAQNSNTFANVGVGTHTILVTDSKNCTSTISNITIAPQLQLAATLTQDLTCLVDASINATVSGGYGTPYTYTVSRNGAAATAVTSFPYTATLAGTYVFTVADSQGCPAASNTITVSPKTTPTLTTTKTDISCAGANDGTITVTAANGFSSSYTYAIKLSTAAVYTTQATNQFTGLAVGTYNIKVIDSKGCESSVSDVIIANPAVITANATATAFSCSTTNTKQSATITVAPTGGTSPYTYSYDNGGTFTSNNTLTVNDNGSSQTFNIVVKDFNSCLSTVQAVVLSPLNPPTDLAFANAAITCTATSTMVTVTATNGVGVLQYETIAPSPIIVAKQTSTSFTGLTPGTYTFRATDANGCYYTESYILAPVTPIVLTANKTSDVLCRGEATGSGTYTASGNATVGNYTFTLTAGTLGSGTLTKSGDVLTLSGVAVGTYTVQVTDTATGCTSSASIVINQPAVGLSISSALASNINCNNDTSNITVTAAGGTPNYSYAFAQSPSAVPTSAYGSSAILTVDTNSGANLAWDVYVRDVNGCTAKSTITVVSSPIPTVTAVVNNQCTASGSNFTITATGTGVAPLTYGIGGATGAFQASSTFTVASGTYTVSVKDANGCIVGAATPTIVSPQLTTASAVTKTIDCSVSPDGVITTTITGGRAPYTFTVQKGVSAPSGASAPSAALTFTYSISNANADTYTFRVTDANGCISTSTAIVNPITNPTVTETHVNPLCSGNTNGSVQLVGAGGSGGYTYSNDNVTYVASGLFAGLASGSYTFYVRDSKGCTGTVVATLVNPVSVTASAVITTPFSCSATNTKQAALITVTGSGGTGTYTYSFNNGTNYSPSNTLTVNDNGASQSFDIIVKDGNGCLSTVQAVVLSPLNPPTISGITGTPIYCAPVASTTSTVTIATTVGTGVTPLAYTITSGPVTNTTGVSTGIFTGLTAGTYTFRVTDANGCFAIQSHTVNPVSPIAVIATKLTDVDCFGNTTGSIRYQVSGFTSTYSYTINGGVAVTAQNAGVFTLPSLGANTYNVVFTDETTACITSTSIIITEPAAALSATVAQVNANCFTATSQITVTASGGTSAYTYAFKQDGVAPIPADYVASNVANLNPVTNLNWDVWVKDANGCTFKLDIVITQDPLPAVTASAVGQCLGVGSYTITASGSGGVAPLTYSINGGGSYQAGNTFVVTTAGNYTIRVKDANGCTTDSNVISVAPQLTLSAVLNKDITCNPAPTNALITLTVGGGVGPFTYESKESSGAYTAMASNVFNSSIAGSYTFRVTDAATCTAVTTTAITITTPVNPDITAVTNTQSISCHGDNTAAISITIDNTLGQAPFVFNVLNTTTSTNYGTQTSGLTAGNYTITVTDAKGCTDTFAHIISEPAPMTYTYAKNEIICSGAGTTLGSIIATPSGGTGAYTYTITNNVGATVTPPNISGGVYTFDIVNFGIYELSFVDVNGCSHTETITMASPPSDLLIDVSNAAPNCTTSTIKVTVNPTVVGGPYHFALFPIISGSTPPYDYATNIGSYQNADDANPANQGYLESTFTNLNPGVIYSFIVYDEATHCYYFKQASSPTLTTSTLISTVSPNNVQCRGGADGTVDFTFTNNYPVATDVTYQVFNSQTNLPTAIPIATVTGLLGNVSTPINGLGLLGTGTYYILFQEASSGANNGCTNASTTFAISESPVDLTLSASKIKNVNCNEDGVIAAQAQGGTAPYTYQYLLAPVITPPDASSVGWITNTTFATNVAGNYIVYVKDAYGCIQQAPVTLDADIAPTVTAPAAPICYDGTPFTIVFSGTVDPAVVGAATYSVNGSAFQATPSFTFNTPGIYNLVIKDGNGCTATVPYEVYPQLQLSAALTKELDCTATPDATITLTATGGEAAANYTYEVDYNGGGFVAAVSPYTATTAGNYVFRVTDANNATLCQATTNFVLDPIPTTTFTTSQINVSCNGGSDGSITVNVTSGVGPYEYQLDAGLFQASNVFTGLTAGTTYVVTVRDSKLCEYPSATITIVEPGAVSASSAITTSLTCGVGNIAQPATVTVTASGGTAPYQYSFDGGTNYSSTNTYQSYVGTTFDVYVKDAKGCPFVLANGVNIPALVPPTDLTFSTTVPVTCLVDGTVEITGTTGGVGILQYETVAPSPIIIGKQTSTTFTGLTDGTYLFQVTDVNGCTYQESYTVAPVTNITVSGQLISDVTCNPGSNGEVLFTVGNFASTYSYVLNSDPIVTGQTALTIPVTGLSTASTQTIVITDELTGCTATTFVGVSIGTPLALVADAFINANCNNGAQVSVTASGGVSPYSYSYVVSGNPAGVYTGSASAVLDPAVSTTWDVYVKDANDCVITTALPITIATDASPIIAMPASQCFVGTPITVDLSIGETVAVGPATYTINGSNQTSSNYTINAPGTYQFSIVDGNGCSSNIVDYIVQPQVVLDAVLTQDLTCLVDGSITLTASGGTGTYNAFEVSIDGAAFVAAVSPYIATVDGSYVFRVSDDQVPSCPAFSSAITVTAKTTPTFTTTQSNVSCIGGNDGSIVVTAADGIAPYTFALAGTGANSTGDVSGVYTGLIAGSYTVVVTDAKGCTSLVAPAIVITEPTAIVASAAVTTPLSCGVGNVAQVATVTVSVTAGTGTAPYLYSFDGGTNYSPTNTYTTSAAGTISALVKDANGCIIAAAVDATIAPLNPPTDLDFASTAVTCLAITSDVTLTTTDGVAALAYEILSPASSTSNTSGAVSGIFTGLAPDTYTFLVTDSNGCTYQESYTVAPVTNITVAGSVTSEVTCLGLNNGSAVFTVENFAGTFTAAITTGTGTLTTVGNQVTISALAAGPYTVTVTDNVTGCTATASVVITEPVLALSSTSVATNINCNNDTATVTISAAGGTTAYQYAIARAGDPVPTTFVLGNQLIVDTNNGADMNWVAYVRDANGCATNNAQVIILDANPIISDAVADQCPSATGTYDITVTATGFSPALTYSVDGISFQASNIITVNTSGNYNVIVKDANGCLSALTPVSIFDALNMTAVVDSTPTCADGDGVVTVTATGGSGNYQYNIDGGVFGAAGFNTVSSGAHSMGVLDTTTLCEFYVPITLTPATPITGFDLDVTPVTCNGGNDGTITATMDTPAAGVNDNPVYMYSLNGGTPQASNVFTGLNAGTYTVDVVSERGCTETANIAVIEPGLIIVPAPAVAQFGCNTGTNAMNFATITVAGVTGGSGVYTQYEFIKNGTQVQFSANNVYTEADLLGGTFDINVYDDKGCIGSALAPVVIDPFISLDDVNVAITTAITCTNNQEILVTVDTTGGIPAAGTLTYTVSGLNGTVYNATNATGIFTNLLIGQYQIDVLNSITGCTISAIHYVDEPNTFQLDVVKTSDVICFGSNEGEVELTFVDNQLIPTNDAAAFDYVVTGPTASVGTSANAGPLTLSGLTAGLYSVTASLTNSPFCSATTSFTIDQPSAALVLTETHTEITCIAGNNDGSISASATGGWAGVYEYELVGPVNVAYGSQTYFENLTAGNYTINVRDFRGCIATATVTLANPLPITITATPSTAIVPCLGDKTASLTATGVTGGQGSNYLYTLNYESLSPVVSSGPQMNPTFTGLGAGDYSITVTDGWSCGTTSAIITITEPTIVEASLVLTSNQTCLILSTITLTANGGTAPYSYSTTANFASSIAMVGGIATIPVPVGTYRYYVRDVNGCTSYVSNDIKIDPLPVLTVKLDLVSTAINCKGDATGVVIGTATGGLGSYVYTLQDASGNPIAGATQNTPGNFTQLTFGTYRIFVESGDCSAISGVFSITEPANALTAISTSIDATCNGLNNGRIEIAATGGTGIIKYAISPDLNQFFDIGIFEKLAPGSYDIITQDQNGCYIYETGIIISEPTPIFSSVDMASVDPEVCFGDNDGAFSINITGGTEPYQVRIDGGAYVQGTSGQTYFNFTGLRGGNHLVQIIDANSCSNELDFALPQSVKLDPKAVVDYGCDNNSPSLTVTVTIDPSVDPADVDYALDGVPYASTNVFQSSNVFTIVTPGAHQITARHTNGCETNTINFNILQVDPLTLVLTDGELNEIVATVTGGAGGYQYTLNGQDYGSQSKYIYYKSGDYTVTVTDANGCTATATRYFEFVDIEIPNVFTPNGDGSNDGWAPTNTLNYPDLEFDIFDRYGRKVGSYREGQFWDGKYDGKELPTGDYWYIIKLKNKEDSRKFVGHFTLYR